MSTRRMPPKMPVARATGRVRHDGGGSPIGSKLQRFQERRVGDDVWSFFTRWCIVLIYTILAVFVTIFHMALAAEGRGAIEAQALLDGMHQIRSSNVFETIFWLMVGGLVMSVLALFVLPWRNRRKSDQSRFAALVLGAVSLIGLIACLWLT